MIEILVFIGAFWLGIVVGFILKSFLVSRAKVSGTIFVTRSDEKLLYSLVLEDYPESIEFKKQIVFKVDASEPSPDRD
jgi:hypothetical protein